MDKFARTVIATRGLRLGAGVSLSEFLPRARQVLSDQNAFDDVGGVFHGFRRLVDFEEGRGVRVGFSSRLIEHSLGVYTLHRALANAFPADAGKQGRVFEALRLKLTGSSAVPNDLASEDLRRVISSFDDFRQSVLHDVIHDVVNTPEARAAAVGLLRARGFIGESVVRDIAANLTSSGKNPFKGLEKEEVCSVASHLASFYSKAEGLPDEFRQRAENVGLFIHLYNNACLNYAGRLGLLERGLRVSSPPAPKKSRGWLKGLGSRLRRKK